MYVPICTQLKRTPQAYRASLYAVDVRLKKSIAEPRVALWPAMIID